MQVAFGYHLPVVVVDLVVASPAQRYQIVDVGGTALRPGPDVMGLAHGGVLAAAPAAAVTGDQRVAHVGSQRMQALHHQALESGVVPVVPAGALAQVWRGGPQPMLSRLLAGCRVEALDESRARSAGAALVLAETSDVIDASVALGAAVRGDADDIQHLASAIGLHIETVPI